MSTITYPMDKARDLLFRSSDGKTFSISKERAGLSAVFRDMLGSNGEASKKEIEVAEKTRDFWLFLSALGMFGFTHETPSALQNLKVGDMVTLLRLADKYHALLVGFFVEQQVWYCSRDGGLTRKGWKRETSSLYSFMPIF